MPEIFDTYIPGGDAAIALITKTNETARDNIVNLAIRYGAEIAVYKETSMMLLYHAMNAKKIGVGDLVPVAFSDGKEVCRFDGIEFCNWKQCAQVKLTRKLKSGKWAKYPDYYNGEFVKFIQSIETSERKDAQDER